MAQGIRWRWRRLTGDVPIAQCRRARYLRVAIDLRTRRYGDAARGRTVRFLAVAVVVRRRTAGTAVHLHVFPQRGRVGVGFVAAGHPAVVGFVGRMNVRVFFAIRGVGESSVTAFVFALERFFA